MYFLPSDLKTLPYDIQAGKSKPVTGVVLLDGSDISRDGRSGDVLAEILVKGRGSEDLMPVVATFSSPWPLGTFHLIWNPFPEIDDIRIVPHGFNSFPTMDSLIFIPSYM